VKDQDFSNMTDEELLSLYQKTGDNNWLGVLLKRYTLLLLGVSMKYLKNEEEAKDNVQQVFIKVLEQINKHKVTYFKSWLYIVTKNECLMKIRSKNGKYTTEITDRLLSEADKEDSEQEAFLEKDLSLLATALKELNEEQQQCISLFYLQKMPYQQISEKTGFSPMQVKSYIQNGKRNLKIIIERKRNEQGPQ
jgi:RNA polymerase sigma-70 factor (ECF subfamily)